MTDEPDLTIKHEDGSKTLVDHKTGEIVVTKKPAKLKHRARPGMAQPHNRQWKRAQHRARKKRYAREKRASEPKMVKPNPVSMLLPTHLIHKILRINGVGRHTKGRALAPSLSKKIARTRGAKRKLRRSMERHSRRVNRAA